MGEPTGWSDRREGASGGPREQLSLLPAARGLRATSWLSHRASSFSGAKAESPRIPHSAGSGCLKRPRTEIKGVVLPLPGSQPCCEAGGVDPLRWWRTEQPGGLQFVGSQGVRHDWAARGGSPWNRTRSVCAKGQSLWEEPRPVCCGRGGQPPPVALLREGVLRENPVGLSPIPLF